VVLRKRAWIAWGVRAGCKKTADEGLCDDLDCKRRGTLCPRWYKENRSNVARGGAAIMKLGTCARVQ
jgi:hypothetical protein